MITTKQRAYLRGLGNALEPLAQVGKDGLSENVIEGIGLLLEARELVKIKALKNVDEDVREIAEAAAAKLGAEVVQVIGNIFILYKKSTRKNFKHIQLP
ncbi:MAG: ribosome assembly RNA-binding protein YhbY [Clostridia bacterium]|nr:ribosome assembly RNA-binding protein YhbY [Clostridia bacterium]